MTDIEIQEWIGFFENIGEAYCRTMLLPQWNAYEGCKEPWQAIAFFLEGYAFERQGTNPGFAHAAVDTVRKYRDRLNGSFEDVESEVWEDYKQRLRRNINEKLCPLNPSESAERRSIFSRLRQSGEANLAWYAARLLQNDPGSAHTFISSIRGSGRKIASYYLRDLKEAFPVATNNLRFLLQPIDIWIWRTVHIMQGHRDFPRLGQAEEQDIERAARFVVDHSCNHNPERVNMGMWYFAAEVCGSEYRHGACLQNPQEAKTAWNEYVLYRVGEAGQIALLKFRVEASH